MNGATFRALRETVGLSQRAVAQAQNVTERAVKLWERSVRPVPNGVADWMNRQLREHDAAVDQIVDASMQFIESTETALGQQGGPKPPVDFTYWRTQQEFDASHALEEGPGEFSVVNARTRSAAELLRSEGIPVGFNYIAKEPAT